MASGKQDVLKELEEAGVIDYQEVYRRTKSHVQARAYVRAQSRQQRERTAAKADHLRFVKHQELENEKARKREKTNGPPPISSPIECEKRRKKKPDLSKTTLRDFEFGELLRHALLRKELVIQWEDMSDGVPKVVLDAVQDHGKELEVMRLSGNRLKTLPEWGKQMLPRLKVLHISNNRLQFIPDSFCEFKNLQDLDASTNKLEVLPETVYKLSSLKRLILSDNLLGSLPAEIGKLIDLQEIQLPRNHLEYLPSSFKRLKFLKRCNLERNKLGTLALIPKPSVAERQQLSIFKETQKKYKEVTMYGETVYFNEITGETTRVKPKQALQDPWAVPACEAEEGMRTANGFQDPIDALGWGANGSAIVPKLNLTQLPRFAPTSKMQYQSVIEERKQALVEQNKGEWSFHLDLYDGRPVFTNNIFREEYNEVPIQLDNFGELVQLEWLSLRGNNLDSLPDSVSQLVSLRHLDVSRNRLKGFPHCISALSHIEKLDLSDNTIEWIPGTIVGMDSLSVLNVSRNNIYHIADEIGMLTHLKELNIMSNELEAIPLTVADLQNLETFNYSENFTLSFPDPGTMKRVKDVKSLQYELRQYRLREKHGPEPVVYQVAHGIENECLDTNAHYEVLEKELIDKAKEERVLLLHWKALEWIPPQVFSLEELLELHMVGNQIQHIPDEIGSLTSLRVLELRNNGVHSLSEKIGSLRKLEVFSIQDNKISSIPASIRRLRKLKVIHFTNNLLEELPDIWQELSELTELHVESNRIAELPQSLGCLTSLTRLHLSCNNLKAIPDIMSQCTQLERLHANQNEIAYIPESLSQLGKLKVLRLGHNNISEFPECLGNGAIASSLEELWLYSNHIVELSSSFQRMEKLVDVRLDFNPMRSPPMELSAQGVPRILQYCRDRSDRISEIVGRLRKAKFEIDEERLLPKTQDLLVGGVGHLSEKDKERFDTYVDQYINADFYQCKPTGKQIVDGLESLRGRRQEAFRRKLVLRLLMVLELLEDEDLVDGSYFQPQVMLRWGTMLQKADCFAIRPEVLFATQEDPPHESVQGILETREKTGEGDARDNLQFRSILFLGASIPITKEAVFDALEAYKDPFGNSVGQGHRFIKFEKLEDCELSAVAGEKMESGKAMKKQSGVGGGSEKGTPLVEEGEQMNPGSTRKNGKHQGKESQVESEDDGDVEEDGEEGKVDDEEEDHEEEKDEHVEEGDEEAKVEDVEEDDEEAKVEDGDNSAARNTSDRLKSGEEVEVSFSSEESEAHGEHTNGRVDIKQLEAQVVSELKGKSKKPGFFRRMLRVPWGRKKKMKMKVDTEPDKATAVVANPEAKVKKSRRSVYRRKPKPGEKEAFVLRKLVYTEEEGVREKQEDADLQEAIRKTLFRLDEWFKTKYARGKVKLEIRRRRERERRKLQRLERNVAKATVELSNARHNLKEVKLREKNFKKKLPFNMHRFNNEQEMTNLLKKCQEEVGTVTKKLENAKLEAREKKREPVPGNNAMMQECHANLKEKILARTQQLVVDQGRQYAYQNNLRRPWDGRNGKEYQVWKIEQDKLKKDAEAEMEDKDAMDHDDDEDHMVQEETAFGDKNQPLESAIDVDKLVKLKYCWSSDEYSDDESEPEEAE